MKQDFATSELTLESQIRDHFITMSDEKVHKVKVWHKYQNPQNIREARFLYDTSVALEIIGKEYKVSTMECSVLNGKLYYQKGATIEEALNCYEWERKVREFAPSHESGIATLSEAVLWYAYRVASGFWTLDYVCRNSKGKGNYRDSSNASLCCEPAGERMVGGARDGVGNTYRLVKLNSTYLIGGGCFWNLGEKFPVYHWEKCQTPWLVTEATSPMVVLRKLKE